MYPKVSRCAHCRITEGERATDRELPIVGVPVSGSRVVSGAVAVPIAVPGPVPVGTARPLPDAMIRRDRCVWTVGYPRFRGRLRRKLLWDSRFRHVRNRAQRIAEWVEPGSGWVHVPLDTRARQRERL
ncbi:hypothetical protein A5748_09140 [Nocardia sp. 852002-51244_SCH5132740]|nr:hypothetical protein A5748_09140 [Nocardia sp. 852002-51244_SCH5132740]